MRAGYWILSIFCVSSVIFIISWNFLVATSNPTGIYFPNLWHDLHYIPYVKNYKKSTPPVEEVYAWDHDASHSSATKSLLFVSAPNAIGDSNENVVSNSKSYQYKDANEESHSQQDESIDNSSSSAAENEPHMVIDSSVRSSHSIRDHDDDDDDDDGKVSHSSTLLRKRNSYETAQKVIPFHKPQWYALSKLHRSQVSTKTSGSLNKLKTLLHLNTSIVMDSYHVTRSDVFCVSSEKQSIYLFPSSSSSSSSSSTVFSSADNHDRLKLRMSTSQLVRRQVNDAVLLGGYTFSGRQVYVSRSPLGITVPETLQDQSFIMESMFRPSSVNSLQEPGQGECIEALHKHLSIYHLAQLFPTDHVRVNSSTTTQNRLLNSTRHPDVHDPLRPLCFSFPFFVASQQPSCASFILNMLASIGNHVEVTTNREWKSRSYAVIQGLRCMNHAFLVKEIDEKTKKSVFLFDEPIDYDLFRAVAYRYLNVVPRYNLNSMSDGILINHSDDRSGQRIQREDRPHSSVQQWTSSLVSSNSSFVKWNSLNQLYITCIIESLPCEVPMEHATGSVATSSRSLKDDGTSKVIEMKRRLVEKTDDGLQLVSGVRVTERPKKLVKLKAKQGDAVDHPSHSSFHICKRIESIFNHSSTEFGANIRVRSYSLDNRGYREIVKLMVGSDLLIRFQSEDFHSLFLLPRSALLHVMCDGKNSTSTFSPSQKEDSRVMGYSDIQGQHSHEWIQENMWKARVFQDEITLDTESLKESLRAKIVSLLRSVVQKKYRMKLATQE